MKTKVFLFTVTIISAFTLCPSSLRAQGTLMPPGAPAPMMKSLDQIEPRIPIATNTTPGTGTALFKITQPGSYYLTTNLTGVSGKDGIEIAAGSVTLDLMGFQMAGVPGSSYGVNVSVSATNLAICNGAVRGWGSGGVNGASAYASHCENLRVAANGGPGLVCGENASAVNCTAMGNSAGISAGTASVINNCVAFKNSGIGVSVGFGSTIGGCSVNSNTGAGISAGANSTVSGCTASVNSGNGIDAGLGSTVIHCTVSFNGSNGVFTAGEATISGCTAYNNTVNGISATDFNNIQDCTASWNHVDGIFVGSDTAISGCSAIHNTGAGIHTTTGGNRIDGNHAMANGRGIFTDTTGGDLVIRNFANLNSTNYALVAGTVAGTTNVFLGFGLTNNPWANFTF